MVTRIENRRGDVLAEYAPAPPERALDAETDKTLLSVMRDVVTRGTGGSIRTRFGIRGDVAGKTGTTQDNADGWFILMQPGLVAGAWVGFDDGRVTLRSDYWGRARTVRCRSSAISSSVRSAPGSSIRRRNSIPSRRRAGSRRCANARRTCSTRGSRPTRRRRPHRSGRSGWSRRPRRIPTRRRPHRLPRRPKRHPEASSRNGCRRPKWPRRPPRCRRARRSRHPRSRRRGRARRAEAVRASAPHRRPPFDRTAPGAGTGRARRDRRIAVAVTEPFRTRAMLP